MKIKELIEELKKHPENIEVFLPSEKTALGYTPLREMSRGLNEFDGCIFLEGEDE